MLDKARMSFSCVSCYGQVTYSPVASSASAHAARSSTPTPPCIRWETIKETQPMTLFKRASTVLATLGAAGAVVGLSAAPAMAATTLTVKVSNGGSYTATSPKTVLTDGNV